MTTDKSQGNPPTWFILMFAAIAVISIIVVVYVVFGFVNQQLKVW